MMPHWVGLALGVVLGSRVAAASGDDVARFAVVVGNNQAEEHRDASLEYADDDAVAMHRLLLEAGVKSVLLTALDEPTRRLFPDVRPDGPPRAADLEQVFSALSSQIRDASERGAPTEFVFFYSGHGDVDAGEGYVVLEDQRLTRSQLFALLARSPATHNHVFIDACKSYFLAFEKGPGGRRVPYSQSFVTAAIPAHLANTGFVLSTSSDRESHEWQAFQGGILSHELLSALRGAADTDLDGRITYAEIGAFLAAANERVQNPRFRPDFLVRPPAHNLRQDVLRWSARSVSLRVGGAPLGHFYVEDARGERFLDAHPAEGQVLHLHVPPPRPVFVRSHDEKLELEVAHSEVATIRALVPVAREVRSKGAGALALNELFVAPFGARDVRAFERTFATSDTREIAGSAEPGGGVFGVVAGSLAVGAGAAGLTLNAWSAATYLGGGGASQVDTQRLNERMRKLNLASIVCYAVAGAAGVTWGLARLGSRTSVSIGLAEREAGSPGKTWDLRMEGGF